MDLAASFAGPVSRPAVDRSVHLSAEFTHVVGVEDGDFLSFAFEAVLFVAGFTGVRAAHDREDLLYSFDVSDGMFPVGVEAPEGVDNSLQIDRFLNIQEKG